MLYVSNVHPSIPTTILVRKKSNRNFPGNNFLPGTGQKSTQEVSTVASAAENQNLRMYLYTCVLLLIEVHNARDKAKILVAS